jgi:ubiquitin carboxyl-terminal hydrolase L3
MVEEFNWPPLESNPEIFTEYMQKLGLPSTWGFSEMYGFDEDLLGMIAQPVVAVILNAEYKVKNKEAGSADTAATFYMDQTSKLDNACGVIACLHSIFNNSQVVIAQDSALGKYLASVTGKTSAEKATILEVNQDM